MPTTEQLTENSHQGFEGIKAAQCLAEIAANSNRASGMPACLRPEGTGSRCSGKERDAESGLDYFGARYFSGPQGRFTSVDPENAGASADDPQSWNGYAYARNNPLLFVDPDGRAYRVCERDENGKESNCGVVDDDRAFSEYAQEHGWEIKGGKIMQDGQVIGAAHWFDPKAMETLSLAGRLAAPAGELLTAGMRAFGYIAAPQMMAVADYLSGKDRSKTQLALAIFPFNKVIQKGGNTISNYAAKALNELFGKNLHAREWGRALELLKKENGLPNNFHGSITANGDYIDMAGKVIDNIGKYVP